MRAARRLAAALIALAAGCASPPPGPSAPSVQVMRLEPLADGEQFEVELRLSNLNPWLLSVAGYAFVLEVDGERFAAGRSDEPFELDRFGERLTTLAVIAERPEVARLLAAPGAAEGFDYRIRGSFALASGGALPFEQRGRLLGSGVSY